MINITYTIDNLTSNSVSVKTQKTYDGVPLGEPHRKAYVNSIQGRIDIQAEVPIAQVNAIFAVWSDEPTVNDADL